MEQKERGDVKQVWIEMIRRPGGYRKGKMDERKREKASHLPTIIPTASFLHFHTGQDIHRNLIQSTNNDYIALPNNPEI